MKIQLDTYSYQSRFRNIPANYKIIFTFLLGMVTYVSHPSVQGFVFAGTIVFLLKFAKIPFHFLIVSLIVPCLFLFFSLPALIIGVSQITEKSSDFVLPIIRIADWQFYISNSGLEYANSIVFRSLSLFICVFALFITTPFNEMLQAFHKMGVPQVLLDLLVSMYRFIFIFLQIAVELNQVVKSRHGDGNWRRRLHSAGLIMVQLFIKTFEKYKRMTMVIESRGFTNELFYPGNQEKNVPKKIIGLGFFIILLLIGIEWWCRNS